MSETPWYADGLKFRCTQCGDCCTGAPGFVWVNQEEIEAIAATIGMSDIEQFEREYVRKESAFERVSKNSRMAIASFLTASIVAAESTVPGRGSVALGHFGTRI